MASDGVVTQESMVRFERIVPGPIERVWACLTQSEQLPAWFGDPAKQYSIEPHAGGVVSLADGHVRGIVTQCQPPQRLTYTWNVFGEGETESQFPESYVTFELRPQDDQVALTLTHRPVLTEYISKTMMGWHTFLELLTALLNGEQLEERSVIMERNRLRYGIAPFKS